MCLIRVQRGAEPRERRQVRLRETENGVGRALLSIAEAVCCCVLCLTDRDVAET